MLVSCNQNCKHNVSTDASLDLDADEAVCNYCGETLKHITSYAKHSMKINGDIIRKINKKSFTFKCLTCKKDMKAVSEDSNIVGAGCEQQGDCDFNISNYMKRGIELYSSSDETDE